MSLRRSPGPISPPLLFFPTHWSRRDGGTRLLNSAPQYRHNVAIRLLTSRLHEGRKHGHVPHAGDAAAEARTPRSRASAPPLCVSRPRPLAAARLSLLFLRLSLLLRRSGAGDPHAEREAGVPCGTGGLRTQEKRNECGGAENF